MRDNNLILIYLSGKVQHKLLIFLGFDNTNLGFHVKMVLIMHVYGARGSVRGIFQPLLDISLLCFCMIERKHK